jgi:hypothetical protein
MSETKDETIARLNGGWDRCREELMQTIRERDEARARIAELENIDALETKIAPIIRVAEARGFERGVREAVAAGDKMASEGTYGWVWLRAAILALLDKPSLSPQDKPE